MDRDLLVSAMQQEAIRLRDAGQPAMSLDAWAHFPAIADAILAAGWRAPEVSLALLILMLRQHHVESKRRDKMLAEQAQRIGALIDDIRQREGL